MNHRVVHKRLRGIDENLEILEEMQGVSLDDFVRDPKIHKLAERCFQLCIECVIDIAQYIIAENRWEQPASSKDAILPLGAHGFIPDLFADEISGMAGFRNILVHGYVSIDRAIVFQSLDKLDDLREFQRYILEYLDKS